MYAILVEALVSSFDKQSIGLAYNTAELVINFNNHCPYLLHEFMTFEQYLSKILKALQTIVMFTDSG